MRRRRYTAWKEELLRRRRRPTAKPVLPRIDEQAGHGIGSTIGQAISKQADVYAFLLWQFGLAKLRE